MPTRGFIYYIVGPKSSVTKALMSSAVKGKRDSGYIEGCICFPPPLMLHTCACMYVFVITVFFSLLLYLTYSTQCEI